MKHNPKLVRIGALAIAACLWAAVYAQAGTVYTINQSSTTPEVAGELSPLSDTVLGTLTTDGTIGVLQSNNILSWNLQLIDNLRPASDVTLTPANSGIWFDIGNGLSASATGLSFDFSLAGAVFIIQGTTHGFSSGFQYFCFQATNGPCVTGETIVPDYYSVDGVSATGLSGTLPLDPVAAVPEPSVWAMFGCGCAGLRLLTRRRKSKSDSALYSRAFVVRSTVPPALNTPLLRSNLLRLSENSSTPVPP
jgi:hypothetical protein